MIKVSFFSGSAEEEPIAIPLFHKESSGVFEKTASRLLPDVVRYIETLKPQKGSQYVLVNAMGAGEFWGSNVNGDYFPEAALIHAPSRWMGNPLVDKVTARTWPYGYPTFYDAKPFAHHRNKDASRGFGEVELAAWNDGMKRVELVCRLDEDKCHAFGGSGVWDKVSQGQYPDVSMGCKVPFDTCSICLDWDSYEKAKSTFRAGVHKHPGEAILEWHKRKKAKDGVGIRGLSITRADYCEHAKNSMNRILPDGRKVFVYNDYPKFFDISFVFIGADKTAKTMMKIASSDKGFWSTPSGAGLAEELGYCDTEEKTASTTNEANDLAELQEQLVKKASVENDIFKTAFLGKAAKLKNGEIVKDTIPSQFAAKAVPVVSGNEPSLPTDLLNLLGGVPLSDALSTASSLGITLRPKEFQRVVLVNIGNKSLADELDNRSIVFSREPGHSPSGLFDGGNLSSVLLRLLLPFLEDRSVFGPPIEQRSVQILMRLSPSDMEDRQHPSSLSSDLLRKIGAAYNTYRKEQMDKVAAAQDMITDSTILSQKLSSIVHLPANELFTPMSAAHLKLAYWGETGIPDNGKAIGANVERGFPSKNTLDSNVHF